MTCAVKGALENASPNASTPSNRPASLDIPILRDVDQRERANRRKRNPGGVPRHRCVYFESVRRRAASADLCIAAARSTGLGVVISTGISERPALRFLAVVALLLAVPAFASARAPAIVKTES